MSVRVPNADPESSGVGVRCIENRTERYKNILRFLSLNS